MLMSASVRTKDATNQQSRLGVVIVHVTCYHPRKLTLLPFNPSVNQLIFYVNQTFVGLHTK